MRVATDQYVNGARPTGALEQRPCVELRAASGLAWALVALDEGETLPAEGQLVMEEGAEPATVVLLANPSGPMSTVPLTGGAQVSARPGYPRLTL